MSETVNIAGNQIVFPGQRPKYNMHPQIAMDIVDYFLDRQNNPDDPDNLEFQGFDRVAFELKNQLEKVSKSGKNKAPVRCLLPVMPLDDHEPYILYRDFEPEATTVLKLLTDRLTHAEPFLDNRDENTGYGQVVSHGYYNGQHIYFFETHTYDETGEYMTWEVANEIPEYLLPEPAPTRSFVTQHDAKVMEFDVYYNLRRIPTAKIDESEVVRSWISRGHKAA